MATAPYIHSSTAAVLLVAAMLLAASVGVRSLFTAGTASALQVTHTLGHARAVPSAYAWPVKPFHGQHAVRANLDDPRIGHDGGESFHFGIDIAVPDGTPVYAVTGGEAYVRPGNVAVVDRAGHSFAFWHVRAAVRNHQSVRQPSARRCSTGSGSARCTHRRHARTTKATRGCTASFCRTRGSRPMARIASKLQRRTRAGTAPSRGSTSRSNAAALATRDRVVTC